MAFRVRRVVVALLAASILAFSFTAAATAAPAAPVVTGITAGWSHTCALMSGGTVKCWGDNTAGQLGDGSTDRRLGPVDVVGLTGGVTAIAAGEAHSCAVTSGGGVKCWGQNKNGQLGNGTLTDSLAPVDVVGLSSGVTAIAADSQQTCALTTGGGVKCWGFGGFGPRSAVPIGISGLSSGVTAIAAGYDDICGLTSEGGVKCLDPGLPPLFSPTAVDVAGLTTGVVAIAAKNVSSCALTSGGGVKCWGSNLYGDLGNGSEDNLSHSTPVDVTGLTSGVAAIAVGGVSTCAVTTSGGAKCWGYNGGLLGNTSATDALTPVDVPGLTSGVKAVAIGAQHACALTTGGGVKCWGDNSIGQLGVGSPYYGGPVDVPFVSAPTAGATTSAWRAKVGASGANGTANITGVTNGAGSIGLKLVKLRASSTLAVVLYKGTCASVGAVLLMLAPIKTTSAGAASRTNTLTAAQVMQVLAATAGSGKIAIRVGSGASAKCGAFAKRAVPSPQAVVQAFYDWYLSPTGAFSRLPSRADLTPGFIRLLKSFRGAYDPIVCAQDVPDWAKAGPAAISGSSATVHVTDSFSSAAGIPVKLALGPGGWQISGVQCVA